MQEKLYACLLQSMREDLFYRNLKGNLVSHTTKKVFVCGVPRSGTTALTEIMNLHPGVVIGVERYKTIWVRSHEVEGVEALFQKERFFDHRPEDTNVPLKGGLYGDLYRRAEEKFADAEIVGDKVPMLYKKIPFLTDHFPECRIVVILREPADVAKSWQARADKPMDKWPEKNGYQMAVETWNASLEIVERQKKRLGDDLILLNYETCFGENGPKIFAEFFQKIGASADLTGEQLDFLAQSKSRLARPTSMPENISQFVQENANLALFNKLSEQSLK